MPTSIERRPSNSLLTKGNARLVLGKGRRGSQPNEVHPEQVNRRMLVNPRGCGPASYFAACASRNRAPRRIPSIA